jgi:predicted Zn-dependent protease
LLLGRILSLQHQPEEALPYLKQAASSEPTNFEAHAFLADAYDALGDSQTAASERARSESLKNAVKR